MLQTPGNPWQVTKASGAGLEVSLALAVGLSSLENDGSCDISQDGGGGRGGGCRLGGGEEEGGGRGGGGVGCDSF